jgi:hypothetical protein
MHSVNIKLTDDVSDLVNTYLLKFNITKNPTSKYDEAPSIDTLVYGECGLSKSVQIDKVICSTEKEIYFRICTDVITPGLYIEDF